jgi:hypothetical protein
VLASASPNCSGEGSCRDGRMELPDRWNLRTFALGMSFISTAQGVKEAVAARVIAELETD